MVTDIERDYVNHRLIFATYGRGIWEAILPGDECYDEVPLCISNTVNWNVPQTICKDVFVEDGGYLIISNEIHLSKGARITIEDGGIVNITTGAQLFNGDIKVLSGGSLTIQNNGVVELSNGDNIYSEIGGTLQMTYGSVIIN